MLLAIDLGNTNITLGVFSADALIGTFRLASRRQRTADEYAVLIRQVLAMQGVPVDAIRHAVLASVVPALTNVLADAVQLAFSCGALVVGPELALGITLSIDRPQELGADRIVNAVAARELALRAAGESDWGAVLSHGSIVIDLGTATKLDCLSPAGEFLGGVIAPGLRVSLDALISAGAKLPPIELVAPASVVGKNTIQCLQSGIVYGYASLVDGLVTRLRAELAFPCDVVVTGGLATVVAKYTQHTTSVDPDLTLRGLWLIHARNHVPRECSRSTSS
jgi:type III pantothenate kinase